MQTTANAALRQAAAASCIRPGDWLCPTRHRATSVHPHTRSGPTQTWDAHTEDGEGFCHQQKTKGRHYCQPFACMYMAPEVGLEPTTP